MVGESRQLGIGEDLYENNPGRDLHELDGVMCCQGSDGILVPSVSRDELEAVIKKIVAKRAEFVAQKQKGALRAPDGRGDAGGPGLGGREGRERAAEEGD